MDKLLFQQEDTKKRVDLLDANCESVEEKGYMKQFTPEQISAMKDELAETSIEISEVEAEKKSAMDDFKLRLKPLDENKSALLNNIKNKAQFVTEPCYKFIDQESAEVGYYNAEGMLIESRPVRPDERQKIIPFRKTGTHN